MVDKVVKPWDVYRAHIRRTLEIILKRLRQVDAKVSAAARWVLEVCCNSSQSDRSVCLMRCQRSLRLQAQELEPWVKWVILDALLALVIGSISTKVPRLQSAFRAIGWL